jgi:hypothetical protein
MYAERLILETDLSGKLKKTPKLPPNKRLEVIFLDLAPSIEPPPRQHRRPHPDIIGNATILGNIMDSAPENDWALPK